MTPSIQKHHDFLLFGLNPEQQQVVQHDKGPCLVSAVAGAGKTKAIVHRMAYLVLVRGVEARRILATTFTRKAAGEMKERLDKLIGSKGQNVRTFHSLSAAILREDFPGFPAWDLNEAKFEGLLKDACGHLHLKLKNVDIQSLQGFIGLCKADMAEPMSPRALEIAQDNTSTMIKQDMIDAYEKVEQLRIEARVMTFDDWLIEVVNLFDQNPDIAAKWQSKYDYVLQDEANDQSLVQARMIRHFAGGHKNYMAVGDISQCMYAFRGARPGLLVNFEKEWSARVIKMNQNYRSGSSITDLANEALEWMDPSQCLDVRLEPQRDATGTVKFTRYDHQEEEAEQVVDQIVRMNSDGVKWNDNVILYRMNSLSRAVEEAMIKKKVPYHIYGGISFFERKEIKDVLAYLRLACGSKYSTIKDARRCINRPNRFLGRNFLERMEAEACIKPRGSWMDIIERAASQAGVDTRRRAAAVEWVLLLRKIQQDIVRVPVENTFFNEAGEYCPTPEKIINSVVKDTGYLDWIRKEEGRDTIENDRISNVAELARAAEKFDSVPKLLDHVEAHIAAYKEAAKEEHEKAERVHLMSIHRSKALEYPNVYVVTCNQGVLPHVRGDEEEEKRIFYVAVTRARDNLNISCVREAISKGRIKPMDPSEFISHHLPDEDPKPELAKVIPFRLHAVRNE